MVEECLVATVVQVLTMCCAVLWCAVLWCAVLVYRVVLSCRPDYMTTFCDKLINWDAVAKRYEAATA